MASREKKPDYPYAITIPKWKQLDNCKAYDNILETIGNTPLVRLNKIPKDHGLKCEIYVKCEFMNPGGSVKDRIAIEMMRDLERKGVLKEGTRIIEPTSGNTGIGLAISSAVCGYPSTIVTPEKNAGEKLDTLTILGADVVATPNVPTADPRSFMSVAEVYLKEWKNVTTLGQFENEVNPTTHYMSTGPEILTALKQVDMLVAGVGTGGTISGIAHRIKEECPECIIVAMDPVGSIMLTKGTKPAPFKIEGVGGDFVPKTFDPNIIDKVVNCGDKEAFLMAREVIKKEGLLCGGSSGAILVAAIKAAKEMNIGAGKNIVIIMPDGIRNYMTKFVCDQWMEANLYVDPPVRTWRWWNDPISNLKLNEEIPILNKNASCINVMKAMGKVHNVALIVDDNSNFVGAVTKDSLRNKTSTCDKDNFDFNDKAVVHIMRNCYKLVRNCNQPTVGLVTRVLDITPFVVIVEKVINEDYSGCGDCCMCCGGAGHDKPKDDNKKPDAFNMGTMMSSLGRGARRMCCGKNITLSDIYLARGILTSDIVWDYIATKEKIQD